MKAIAFVGFGLVGLALGMALPFVGLAISPVIVAVGFGTLAAIVA